MKVAIICFLVATAIGMVMGDEIDDEVDKMINKAIQSLEEHKEAVEQGGMSEEEDMELMWEKLKAEVEAYAWNRNGDDVVNVIHQVLDGLQEQAGHLGMTEELVQHAKDAVQDHVYAVLGM